MNADKYRIYNETRQCLVATDAEATDGTTGCVDARLFELTPASGAAFWISPFRNISAACAPIPLDLVYVNSDGVVLDTVEFFPMNGPGAQSARAASVIALPADTVARGGTRPGDRLHISAAEQMKQQLEKPQNGNGKVHDAKAAVPGPENGDHQVMETGEADAKWVRITDVTRRMRHETGEAKEKVKDPLDQGVNGRGDLLAIPTFEEIERLLRQLQETNGGGKQTAVPVEPDGGGVAELTANEEEELADMPRASVDAEPPEQNEPHVGNVAELTAKKEEELADTPRTIADLELPAIDEEEPSEVAMAGEPAEEKAGAAPVELTNGAMAAESSQCGHVTPAGIVLDAADEGTDRQGGQLGLFPSDGQEGQLGLFPSVELQQSLDLPQDAPMQETAGGDDRPSAGINALQPANNKPVAALRDVAHAETSAKKAPAAGPALSREMPTGGATAEVAGDTAIAPSTDRSEFLLLQLLRLGGSVFPVETVRPAGPSAIAGYEEKTVRFESPNETHQHLTTAAQSIPRSNAGTSRHPGRTSAKRTSATDGRAGSGREALSNSSAAELPRGKVPEVKPNAQLEWERRGVVPRNWIEHLLLDDTLVRRSIQSLLLNDTPTKKWILRELLLENPNDHWIEDMLSREVLDPRRGPRESVPGLIAYFFTGGPSVQHPIRDISATGLYIVTKVRWYEGTVVRLTLTDEEKPTDEGSVTVQGKVVRTGDDGVGFEMLLEGSPAHDGRFERHVPTNGVQVAHLGQFLQTIRSNHARNQRMAGIR